MEAAKAKYVAYRRVSKKEQGKSGLGLDAQMADIETFVAREGGEIVAAYTDVLSGADNTRPELAKAMTHARKLRATVIVSKLDRLSRDAGFIQDLMDGRTKFLVVALGKDADPMMIALYAQMAQKERQMISERIKGALKAAKARGTVIGSPHAVKRAAKGREIWHQEAQERAQPVLEMIEMIRSKKITTLKGIAVELTRHGIATPSERKHGIKQHERMSWTATQVSRVLSRAA
ncbi:hypothetical protein ADL19_05680 [Streptomyces purpurogeneiscleroticus]|nr:hypothetical protein ADL19_05680 [Streptomyces purpurogeneiscleroticus]